MSVSTISTKKQSFSILAYSSNAVKAFRLFSKEDFLHMMSDMTLEDIALDLERFKALEEYEICHKLQYVIREKKNADNLSLDILPAGIF